MNLKAVVGLGLAGAALGVTGCVEFEGPITGKQISKDEVKIEFRICDDRTQECNPEPEAARRGDETAETRVLIAIRAPKGTDLPKEFQPKGVDVTFNDSNSYSAQMNAKAPRKDAEKWFGYISQDITGESATEANFRVIAELPENPGKSFRFRPVVGYVDGQPESKVTCADNPREGFNDGDTSFACIDDPETAKKLRRNISVPLD